MRQNSPESEALGFLMLSSLKLQPQKNVFETRAERENWCQLNLSAVQKGFFGGKFSATDGVPGLLHF